MFDTPCGPSWLKSMSDTLCGHIELEKNYAEWLCDTCVQCVSHGGTKLLVRSHLVYPPLTLFHSPLSARMAEVGIGISAVVAVGSKFIERSKFAGRHDAIYDKEVDKSIKLAERFDRIPREDVDHFEFEEYTMLRSQYVKQYLRAMPQT